MISISGGRLKDVGSIGFYVPDDPSISLFFYPLLAKLKAERPVYLFGKENIGVLKKYFKKFYIFPMAEKMGYRERLRKKRELPHPHILIIPENISPLHLSLIRPRITIGSKDQTISLNGNSAFHNLSKLLGAENILPRKTRRRSVGYYHPSINIDGLKRVEKEEDLERIGHLFSPPSFLAGIGYIMGLRITLLVEKEIPLLPSEVEQVVVKQEEDIKRFLKDL